MVRMTRLERVHVLIGCLSLCYHMSWRKCLKVVRNFPGVMALSLSFRLSARPRVRGLLLILSWHKWKLLGNIWGSFVEGCRLLLVILVAKISLEQGWFWRDVWFVVGFFWQERLPVCILTLTEARLEHFNVLDVLLLNVWAWLGVLLGHLVSPGLRFPEFNSLGLLWCLPTGYFDGEVVSVHGR